MNVLQEWIETFRTLAESPSPMALLVPLLVVALLAMLGRILRRAGYPGWWALLALVPLVNLVALWVFAYTRWPAIDGSNRQT